MNNIKTGLLLLIGAAFFGMIFTAVLYGFFPQYLCYAVYDVSEGGFYQREELELAPGTWVTEYFVPQNKYLTGVSIGVVREENQNVLVGRLSDSGGEILEERRFALTEVDYEFPFQRWVKPGEQYRLDILFPEENQSSVTIIAGEENMGAVEHISSYIGELPLENALGISYVYGTYSRKLLVFWFLVFFLGGLMAGETILHALSRKTCRKTE